MDDQEKQDRERHKKRSLKRYRKNNECIDRLENKLRKIEDRITAIKSSNYSGMPRGGVPVTIDDLLSDKMDLEKRIARLKAKSRDLKNAVCEEIDSLGDPRYCEILEAYYIDNLSFEDIAEELGYSPRHVIALYSEAISILSVIDQ